MTENSKVLPFSQGAPIDDLLTDLAREGARRMLAEALKAEADAFVASFEEDRLREGRRRIVRHGFGSRALGPDRRRRRRGPTGQGA
jgi:putative transposase